MTVSLHLCEEKLAFADGEVACRIIDVKKLNADGVQSFAVANTGTDDFAAGALAMLELLEATLGRAVMICHETDPKVIAERGAENSASPAPTP